MIKWLESSGALPPNPLLYLSYRANRSISNKNVVFLPLGEKVRMRGESKQVQQFPSPLGERVIELILVRDSSGEYVGYIKNLPYNIICLN